MSTSEPSQIPLFGSTGAFSSMLAAYRPDAKVHDELLDGRHGLREPWRALISAFDEMGIAEVERRFGFADRHLRDNGVVHRIYDALGGSEKPLPLAHVPLLIASDDWQAIERAVIQRADLIDRILSDIYGSQTLFKSGQLPAALIAGNPRFLRPMVGAKPAGGSHLLFYAVDIGRGPDGKWWVLRDLTESPSGAGYMIENRIALSRALPELYQPLNVRRLAGFFRAWREFLNGMSPTGHKVGVLSAGSYNESAFEHAYLARYLGFLLLEGEDLVIRDNKVFASTTSGLQPITVLMRRLNADFADPLAFNANSWIGTPGLALAAQGANVVLANALGSGVAEAAGLMGFLPNLSRSLLGEELHLPNVATWWCGQPKEKSAVIGNLDELVIAPAFGPVLPGLLDEGAVHFRDLGQTRRDQIAHSIATRGIDLVAQEAVHLSTMPVWENDRLEPRPFMLRIFAAHTKDGWRVLPGGFCQVSNNVDPRAVSLQRGSSVADVWVVSEKPEQVVSLLADESSGGDRQANEDVLPTRTAENLFWLGRYLERAENTVRLVRAFSSRLLEYDADSDAMIPLLARLLFEVHALSGQGAFGRGDGGESAAISALTDLKLAGGALTLVTQARACAAKTRDQLSSDAWTVLSDLVELMNRPTSPNAGLQEMLELCQDILWHLAAFSGLAHQNMNRMAGWHFLQLGGRIERASNVAWLTRVLGDPTAPPGGFEALLEIADSQISFGTLYSPVPTRPQVVDLVVLDTNNPRSLAYQTRRIEEHMKSLAEISGRSNLTQSRKLSITISTEMHVLGPSEVTNDRLYRISGDLSALSDAITSDFFVHWHFASAAPAR